MKLQANKVDDFIKTFNNMNKCFLVYGPDEGLIVIRKQEILSKIMPDYKNSLSLVTLDIGDLKNKPQILSNELNSNSLFSSDKKIILIEDADNSIVKVLNEVFSKPQNNETFLIITSGDLDSKSTLKKFAENNQYFVSLPCYKDDINTVMQLINKKLKENNFKYDVEVIKYLSENFGGNRLIILNEIDKLTIYKGTDKDLTIDDVKICIQNNSEADINNFVNQFAALNIDKTFSEFKKLLDEGIYPVAVIRTLISYIMKLQLFKYQLQNGLSFDEIAMKENIFWKQKPILQQHLQKLSMKNINDLLIILLNQECKLKGKMD